MEKRIEKKLTQKELAKKINVSCWTIYKWEEETTKPSATNLLKLSKALNTDIKYFFVEM